MAEPDQLYAALAYVIRHWRLNAEMSQRDVYQRAQLDKNVYTRLEENLRPFSAVQIQVIAAVHGRQAWQLMREAELLLESGELPKLPRTVREWKRRFG